MPKVVRRVVTGHTPDGRATIVMDGPAPQVSQGADPEGGLRSLSSQQRSSSNSRLLTGRAFRPCPRRSTPSATGP